MPAHSGEVANAAPRESVGRRPLNAVGSIFAVTAKQAKNPPHVRNGARRVRHSTACPSSGCWAPARSPVVRRSRRDATPRPILGRSTVRSSTRAGRSARRPRTEPSRQEPEPRRTRRTRSHPRCPVPAAAPATDGCCAVLHFAAVQYLRGGSSASRGHPHVLRPITHGRRHPRSSKAVTRPSSPSNGAPGRVLGAGRDRGLGLRGSRRRKRSPQVESRVQVAATLGRLRHHSKLSYCTRLAGIASALAAARAASIRRRGPQT